jgi:hypothetical protein
MLLLLRGRLCSFAGGGMLMKFRVARAQQDATPEMIRLGALLL